MVGSIGSEGLVNRVDQAFEVSFDILPKATNLAEFMRLWRKGLEHSGYREITVSDIAKSTIFREFSLYIIQNARDFAKVHNEILEEVRRRRKIRTKAQPFKNLKVEEESVELPFWVLLKGKRERPYLKGNVVEVGGEVLGYWDELLELGIVRPRAVTLSLLGRLYLADLFVHGLGGAGYQEVVDEIIARFFGLKPPLYAVVTLSMGLNILGNKPDIGALKRIELVLRDMEDHPEKYVRDDSPHFDEAKEVFKIIEELKEGERSNRKKLTLRIRELRGELRRYIAKDISLMRRRREEMVRDLEEWKVISFREYPFILFRFEEVKDALHLR